MIDQSELLPMDHAPRDGTVILIRFEHSNFQYAEGPDRERWEQLAEAHWVEFNNGTQRGWTWEGMMGFPTGWKPKAAAAGAGP